MPKMLCPDIRLLIIVVFWSPSRKIPTEELPNAYEPVLSVPMRVICYRRSRTGI